LGLSFAGGDGAGLHPEYTIADAAKGLGGTKAALADTPCHGDLFHISNSARV